MSNNIEHTELYQALRLLEVPGIGSSTAIQLVKHFKSFNNIFKASLKKLTDIEGLGLPRATGIKKYVPSKAIEKEIQFIQKHNIQYHLHNDVSYPKSIKDINDAPLILYSKGNINFEHPRKIAIVGTRDYTEYGRQVTEQIIQELQAYDVQIVSGLAYGIDIIAHRKAVQLGIPTIGFLAHGLDRIYPAAHKGTAQQMLENGGLVTEYTSGTNPDKTNFPMRNRLVAGYADIVLVIESKDKGGALITAKLATSYNREVAAIPGNIYSEASAGCNYLLQTQIAHLVRNGEEIANLMNWITQDKVITQAKLFTELNTKEQQIVDILRIKSPMHIDEIMLKSNEQYSSLAATLLSLEMQSIIKPLAGKLYQLI